MNPPSPKFRDFQRARVYRAERDSYLIAAPRAKLRSIQAAQRYVRDVWTSEFVRQRWPITITKPAPVVKKKLRGFNRPHQNVSTYSREKNEIRLGNLFKPVILHEIAHALDDGLGHDENFTETLLALIKHFFGVVDSWMLESTFKWHGVKWRKAGERVQLGREHYGTHSIIDAEGNQRGRN